MDDTDDECEDYEEVGLDSLTVRPHDFIKTCYRLVLITKHAKVRDIARRISKLSKQVAVG